MQKLDVEQEMSQAVPQLEFEVHVCQNCLWSGFWEVQNEVPEPMPAEEDMWQPKSIDLCER